MSGPSLPPRRRSALWLKLLAALALVVLFAIAALVWIYPPDEALHDDSALRVAIPRVPDDQNGFQRLHLLSDDALDIDKFAKNHGASPDTIEAFDNGYLIDPALFAAFLVQARPALAQLDTYLVLPYFEYPGTYRLTRLGPDYTILIQAANTLALSVRSDLALGDLAAATAYTLRLRRLATRLAEGYPELIQLLVACTIADKSAVVCHDLLNNPALTPAQLAALSAAYARDPGWVPALQRSLVQSYNFFLLALAETQSEWHAALLDPSLPLTRRLGFGWGLITYRENATLNQATTYFLNVRQSLNGPYSDMDPTLPEQKAAFDGGDLSSPWFWLMPNRLGRNQLTLAVGPYNVGIWTVYLAVAQDRLLQTGLALRQYYNTHGSLPTALTTLVPDYLPAVPLDPFDNQPLRYDPALGIVYSVGTDLSDHHGSDLLQSLPPGSLPPLWEPPPSWGKYSYRPSDPAQPILVLDFQKPKAATPALTPAKN